MYKFGLEKAKEPEIKLPTFFWITEKAREFQKIIHFCFIDYTKKGLNDPDNHKGVVTQLEPDILECEVKWALRSITTNKASRGNEIAAELFQILKDDAV